jgi:DHA1 family tetracycline resistance protein-like MFS transporter
MTFRIHPPTAQGAVARLALLIFLDGFAHSVGFPILPRLTSGFVGHDASLTALWVGWLEVAWAVPQILVAPFLGALSDRFGRRPLILLSALGAATELALDATATGVGGLLAGRILCGLTFASQAAIFAGVADVTPPQDRTRAYGQVNGALYGGIILGLLAGGAMAETSLRWPFIAGSIAAALTAVCVLTLTPEPLPRERRSGEHERTPPPWDGFRLIAARTSLAPLAAILLLNWLAFQSSDNMIVLYTQHRYDWSPMTFGVFVAVAAGLGILVQSVLAGAAARRWGTGRALTLGLAIQGLGMLAMGLAATPAVFWPAALFAVLGAICRPALQTLLSQAVGPDEQGRLQGLVASVTSATSIVAPLAFTGLYAWAIGEGRSPAWSGITLVCGAILSFAAAVLAGRARRP